MKPYYSAGGVTLYNGDCLEILDALPHRCGALITDPPFAFTGGISNGRSSETSDQFFTHWWRSVCDKATRACGPDGSGFIWCDWRTAGPIAQGFTRKQEQSYEPWRVSQMPFHYREMPGQGTPFRSSVDMVAYCRGPEHRNPPVSASQHNLISSYWRYGKHPHHPSEKSIKLAGMFADWSAGSGRAVLDPFAGSGTVLLAAKARGIEVVGIEIEEHFCEVIAKRCEQTMLELQRTDAESEANPRIAPNNPPAEPPCADCIAAKKAAWSDATTPGFFRPYCTKHDPETLRPYPGGPYPVPRDHPEYQIHKTQWRAAGVDIERNS